MALPFCLKAAAYKHKGANLITYVRGFQLSDWLEGEAFVDYSSIAQ